MGGTGYQYGLLLPHFGSQASRRRLIAGTQQAERYGFDSVWVRDHLVYHPHHHEDPDATHVDPFIVLAALASATERITLGLGVLIPHRHPIHTALLLGSLDFMAGPNRIICGLGIGTYHHEFEVIGLGEADRREMIEEQVRICRRLWTGERIDWTGKYYQFTGVDVHPSPAGHDLPVWYGGTSMAAPRRAAEYCEGWIPGRMPLGEFKKRVDRMQSIAAKLGRPRLQAGNIPYVIPAPTVEKAKSYLDIPNLIEEFNKFYGEGLYTKYEDLEGAIICGPPDVIIEEIRKCQAAGTDHFVFDMRRRYSDWEECLQIIGEEVLPKLHKADGRHA